MEEMSPRQTAVIKFIFARIFPWTFVIIGALILYPGVKKAITAYESTKWPPANGIVISSTKTGSIFNARTQWRADIAYEYFVLKQTYAGYHQYSSPDAGKTNSVCMKYPKGKRIVAYYKPDDPRESLLEPGLKSVHWFALFGGLLFLVTAVLIAAYLPQLMKRR